MEIDAASVPIAESTSSGKLHVVGQPDAAPMEDVIMHEGCDDLVDVDQGNDDDFELVDDGSGLDEDERLFHQIVSTLEEVMLNPEFEVAKDSFCRQHCGVFEEEDGDGENKLEYMELFSKYNELIEGHLTSRLVAEIPGLTMPVLLEVLASRCCAEARQGEDGAGGGPPALAEVFEDLLAVADFEAFKELMLSYKADAAGVHEGLSVSVRPLQAVAPWRHIGGGGGDEDDSEGDARPDLDFGLSVTGLSASGNATRPAATVAPARGRDAGPWVASGRAVPAAAAAARDAPSLAATAPPARGASARKAFR